MTEKDDIISLWKKTAEELSPRISELEKKIHKLDGHIGDNIELSSRKRADINREISKLKSVLKEYFTEVKEIMEKQGIPTEHAMDFDKYLAQLSGEKNGRMKDSLEDESIQDEDSKPA